MNQADDNSLHTCYAKIPPCHFPKQTRSFAHNQLNVLFKLGN